MPTSTFSMEKRIVIGAADCERFAALAAAAL
jgi:hypothetical protein